VYPADFTHHPNQPIRDKGSHQEVGMGKRDSDRDGQGDAQPEKWENWGSKDDNNKHEDDEEK
jgi:hypothetical protein